MKTTVAQTDATNGSAAAKPAKRKPAPALTEIRFRVNLVKRGRLGEDFDSKRGNWMIETDFHRTGQIKNGPEAMVAEMTTEGTASGINGFDYRLDHDRAKLLAQIFAGAPRLLNAAKMVNYATGREPKFKHSETYRALSELMAAIDDIESGKLIFNPNV